MGRFDRERIKPLVLLGVGVLLVAGLPEALEGTLSSQTVFALSIVGAIVLWTGAIWDDTICRRRRDERLATIHYRAGYNTALAYAAVLGSLIFVTTNLDIRVETITITVALIAGLVVYFGSVAWLKQHM